MPQREPYDTLGLVFELFVEHKPQKKGPSQLPLVDPFGGTLYGAMDLVAEGAIHGNVSKALEQMQMDINYGKYAIETGTALDKMGEYPKVEVFDSKGRKVEYGGSKGVSATAAVTKGNIGTAFLLPWKLVDTEKILEARRAARREMFIHRILSGLAGSWETNRRAALGIATLRATKRRDVTAFLLDNHAQNQRWDSGSFGGKGLQLSLEGWLRYYGLNDATMKNVLRNRDFLDFAKRLVEDRSLTESDIKRRIFTYLRNKGVRRTLLNNLRADADFNNNFTEVIRLAKRVDNPEDKAEFTKKVLINLGRADPRFIRVADYVDKVRVKGKVASVISDLEFFHFRWQAFKKEWGTTGNLAGILTGKFFQTVARGGLALETAPSASILNRYLAAGGTKAAFVNKYFYCSSYEIDPHTGRRVCKEFKPKAVGPFANATFLPAAGAFYLDPYAGPLRQMAFWAYRFHPWSLVKGVVDGGLFYDLWMYGSKGGVLDYADLPWYGKLGFDMLNNRIYHNWLKMVSVVKAFRDLPAFVAAQLHSTVLKIGKEIGKKILVEPFKKIAQEINRRIARKLLGRVLIWATEAISNVAGIVIQVARMLPGIGDLIDRIILEIYKLLLFISTVIILGLFILQLQLFNWITGLFKGFLGMKPLTSVEMVTSSNVYSANPDPAPPAFTTGKRPSSPEIEERYILSLGGYGVDPNYEVDCSIFTTCAAQLKDGALYYTQGPYGTYSHANCVNGMSQTVSFAVDIGTNQRPAPVYAPFDGVVTKCEAIGNKKRGVYTGEWLWIEADKPDNKGNKMIYAVLHVKCSEFVHVGEHVTAGQQVARAGLATDGINCCWSGPHLHVTVLNKTSMKYVNATGCFLDQCSYPFGDGATIDEFLGPIPCH